MPAMPIFRRMQSPYPSWVRSLQSTYRIPAPVLAIDPYNTRYFRAGAQRSVSDALSTDWAGGGLILGADGAYQSFAANQAPVLSGVGLDVFQVVTDRVADPSDFTAWTAYNVVVTANSILGPDGETYADAVLENSASTGQFIYNSHTCSTGLNTFVTVVRRKAGTRHLQLRPVGLGAGKAYANFDFDTGTVGSTGGTEFVSAEMKPLSGGYYKITLTGNYAVAPTGYHNHFIQSSTDAEAPSYLGDGTSGFDFWWGQSAAIGIDFPITSGTRYGTNVTDSDFAALASAYGLNSGLKIGASISLDRLSDPADRCVWSLGADADNCIRVDVTTTNTARLTVRASAVDVLTLETTAFGATGDKAITATLKDGAWALEATGVTGDSDAGTYGLPTLSSFRYGSKFGNSAYLNGDLNNLVLGRAA